MASLSQGGIVCAARRLGDDGLPLITETPRHVGRQLTTRADRASVFADFAHTKSAVGVEPHLRKDMRAHLDGKYVSQSVGIEPHLRKDMRAHLDGQGGALTYLLTYLLPCFLASLLPSFLPYLPTYLLTYLPCLPGWRAGRERAEQRWMGAGKGSRVSSCEGVARAA